LKWFTGEGRHIYSGWWVFERNWKGAGERRVIWGIELTPITSASTVNQLV
jgi:hypothetical protein